MFTAFLHGVLLAFGLILPLGVQNIFVFNQGALHKKIVSSLPVVITASLCDTLLISAAVLGISAIVLNSFWVKSLLLSAGIVFLVYMGVSTWKSKPGTGDQKDLKNAFTPSKQITFATSVSLLNPYAIMDTIGVIGTSSLSYSWPDKLFFAIACIAVSWVWFLGLALTGRAMGSLDKSGNILQLINKISALVMWGSAIFLGFMLI